MDIARSGIILNTEKYDDCVAFYRNLFGLRVLFQEQYGDFRLTCFAFDGSYLMVETGGYAMPEGKTSRHSAAKLRFNVADLAQALKEIRAYGIDAQIIDHDWGSTIDIFDPDGNRIGIRDEATFKNQIDN